MTIENKPVQALTRSRSWLQVQTNPLSAGLGTNWFNVPGSAATNSVTIPTSKTDPTVFYRLRYTILP